MSYTYQLHFPELVMAVEVAHLIATICLTCDLYSVYMQFLLLIANMCDLITHHV